MCEKTPVVWPVLHPNAMHPDQVLLTFAGILYFQKHSKPDVAAGMTARIEKHWKALDQPMFVLALVLNPFEGVSHFRNKASVGSFTLNTILMEVWSIYSQHYSVIYCLDLSLCSLSTSKSLSFGRRESSTQCITADEWERSLRIISELPEWNRCIRGLEKEKKKNASNVLM